MPTSYPQQCLSIRVSREHSSSDLLGHEPSINRVFVTCARFWNTNVALPNTILKIILIRGCSLSKNSGTKRVKIKNLDFIYILERKCSEYCGMFVLTVAIEHLPTGGWRGATPPHPTNPSLLLSLPLLTPPPSPPPSSSSYPFSPFPFLSPLVPRW